MRNDRLRGILAGVVITTLGTVAYGQQSTPPPSTDFAPAAPGATSASPTTDTAAPAAGVTSGVGADTGALDDRANEQSSAAASTGSSTSASAGGFPAPMAQPTSPLDRELGSGVGSNGTGADRSIGTGAAQAAGGRGELGVWMVASGGPGVRVRRITDGSAADMAGLQAGDIILGINGRGASSPHGVAQMIRQMPAGHAATVQYWRNGQTNELEIVLQPMREQYEVAFRGDDTMGGTSRSSGDLETRTMRLEQQLAMVMQELRQLRQEMVQMQGSGSATAIGNDGGNATTATGFDAGTAIDTTPTDATTQPATTSETSASPQPDPFDEATQPAAPPESLPATTPAQTEEPATGEDELFDAGSETEDPTAEGAVPAEDSVETEAAPADSGSGDLFE